MKFDLLSVIRPFLGVPLKALIDDPEVSEIMLNGDGTVWAERHGTLSLCPEIVLTEDRKLSLADSLTRPLGYVVDGDHPICNVPYPDGSRVAITLKPVSIDGPTINIRKFQQAFRRLEELIRIGTLTEEMGRQITDTMRQGGNILISGQPGVGKTSLLNALSAEFGDCRVILIEDVPELQLHQKHVVRLVTKPAIEPGDVPITMRDLLRQVLRMTPGKIVVGEVRGPEAFEFLSALNTGINGSLGTIHAETAMMALRKLRLYVQLAGLNIDVAVIDQMITEQIQMVVQMRKDAGGRRYVEELLDVGQSDLAMRVVSGRRTIGSG